MSITEIYIKGFLIHICCSSCSWVIRRLWLRGLVRKMETSFSPLTCRWEPCLCFLPFSSFLELEQLCYLGCFSVGANKTRLLSSGTLLWCGVHECPSKAAATHEENTHVHRRDHGGQAGDIPGHKLDPCPNPGNTSGCLRLSAGHEVFITATLLSSHGHYTNEWDGCVPVHFY